MSWRDHLDPEDAHGVSTFEVVQKPAGSNTYQPLSPPVSFEAAYRKASARERFEMGVDRNTEIYRVFCDPPLSVSAKQGIRSSDTGLRNIDVLNVTQAIEERGEEIVLLLAERTI